MSFRHLGIAAATLLCISATACGAPPRDDGGLISKMDAVTVSPDKVDPANEGKLVFLQGPVTGAQSFDDPDWEVSGKGLVMKREVAEVTPGRSAGRYSGGTATTATRIKTPRQEIPGPYFFKESMGTVRIGAYTLSPELLRNCAGGWKKLPIDNIDKIPASKFCKLTKPEDDDETTRCWANRDRADVNKPIMVVQFALLPDPGQATVLAMQSGDKLVPSRFDVNKLYPLDEYELMDLETLRTGRMLGVYTEGKKPIEEVRAKAAEAEAKWTELQPPAGMIEFSFLFISLIFGGTGIGIVYAIIQMQKSKAQSAPTDTQPPQDSPK